MDAHVKSTESSESQAVQHQQPVESTTVSKGQAVQQHQQQPPMGRTEASETQTVQQKQLTKSKEASKDQAVQQQQPPMESTESNESQAVQQQQLVESKETSKSQTVQQQQQPAHDSEKCDHSAAVTVPAPRVKVGTNKGRCHIHQRRDPQSLHKKKKKKKKRRPNMSQRPVLRPAGSQVPRAPENSTQFIMDNHENSNLFYNFDSNKETSEEEDETKTPTVTNAFAVNDFEIAYQSAHEESLMASNLDLLKSAVAYLECRCANLQHTIASRPSVLLDSLQSTLIELQEENKHLRQENQQMLHPNRKRSDSDSDSSSSFSDSSDSSSECSQPDCDQCAARQPLPAAAAASAQPLAPSLDAAPQ